jgi:UDP-2,3-diacylglucosamine hydrolase
MILIADTHAGKEGDLGQFFGMLETLKESTEDLVFLGDVFDLWFGLPRYEGPEHRRFMTWCSEQKTHRTIGFVEGNHEFFLTGYRNDCFSWCTDTRKRIGDLVFAHGDLVNDNDVNYQRFRARIRTSGIRRLIRILPFGPSIVQLVKRRAKQTNKEFRNVFPEKELKAYAAGLGKDGVKHAFIGHFHTPYQTIEAEGCTVHCIPGWYVNGEVARFDEERGTVDIVTLALS